MKNLSSELSGVSKWYQLGIKLGLQPSQLHQIEQEVPTDIDRRKTEVVDLWMQNTPGASWRHVVTALKEMGDLATAKRIELKYVRGAQGRTIQCSVPQLETCCISPHKLHSCVPTRMPMLTPTCCFIRDRLRSGLILKGAPPDPGISTNDLIPRKKTRTLKS